jgi:hypothetical protein
VIVQKGGGKKVQMAETAIFVMMASLLIKLDWVHAWSVILENFQKMLEHYLVMIVLKDGDKKLVLKLSAKPALLANTLQSLGWAHVKIAQQALSALGANATSARGANTLPLAKVAAKIAILEDLIISPRWSAVCRAFPESTTTSLVKQRAKSVVKTSTAIKRNRFRVKIARLERKRQREVRSASFVMLEKQDLHALCVQSVNIEKGAQTLYNALFARVDFLNQFKARPPVFPVCQDRTLQ